jgi:hypothetical protein
LKLPKFLPILPQSRGKSGNNGTKQSAYWHQNAAAALSAKAHLKRRRDLNHSQLQQHQQQHLAEKIREIQESAFRI